MGVTPHATFEPADTAAIGVTYAEGRRRELEDDRSQDR
jgi:hypothetical protein